MGLPGLGHPGAQGTQVFGGVVAGLVATTGTALLLLEVWDVTSWWGYVLIALAGAAPLAGYAGVLWSRGETVPDRSTVG